MFEQMAGPTATTVVERQTCSALECETHVVQSCSYVDKRGRQCNTAWCRNHRHLIDGDVFCLIHGHTMEGISYDFGSEIHPDVGDRTVAFIQWMASAAADDVIATLNMVCAMRDTVIVEEPIRRTYHAVDRQRSWEKQWKTLSMTGVEMRICIEVSESHPDSARIRVNSTEVNRVPLVADKPLGRPSEADLDWLYWQVLVPISDAVMEWVNEAEELEGLGYVPQRAFRVFGSSSDGSFDVDDVAPHVQLRRKIRKAQAGT